MSIIVTRPPEHTYAVVEATDVLEEEDFTRELERQEVSELAPTVI